MPKSIFQNQGELRKSSDSGDSKRDLNFENTNRNNEIKNQSSRRKAFLQDLNRLRSLENMFDDEDAYANNDDEKSIFESHNLCQKLRNSR
jgi:hypothetical protein